MDGEGPDRRIVDGAHADRRVVFVGDLVDPRPPFTRRPAHRPQHDRERHRAGRSRQPRREISALARRQDGQTRARLDLTIAQFEKETAAFREPCAPSSPRLPSYLWLDGGRLAVAHAGIKEDMLGRGSADVRGFCLYGETSGETDEFGLPIRYHWAAEYRGSTSIVYGHTPVPDAGLGSTTRSASTTAAALAASSRR